MISVIIPTYNEANNIAAIIKAMQQEDHNKEIEIIVSDAGSTDNTLMLAANAGASAIIAPGKGRAAQMNYAAAIAKGDIFYFVHADTKPPPSYAQDILESINNGYDLGSYRLAFDSKNWLLKINAFCTRFPFIWCRGGDQTLFIKRAVFTALNGFTDMVIMEDYDIIKRAAEKKYRFKVIPKNVLASARKYDVNGYFKVLKANYTIMKRWKQGIASDKEMAVLYKQLLK